MAKTGLNDTVSSATGKLDGKDITIAAMNFAFIGGSMGSVVGEKFVQAVNTCVENNIPLVFSTFGACLYNKFIY